VIIVSKHHRWLFAMLALLACAPASAPHVSEPANATAATTPASRGTGALPASKIERVEKLVSDYMTAHKIPALAIALVVDGQVAWSSAHGLADVENAVPATTETMFRTASMGKTMTATAAMRLAEEKRIDLDADVRSYCPAFPPKQWTLTPRQLLSHLGGIRHYGGPRDREEQTSTTHYAGVVGALAPFKDDALLFEPGTKYSYSTYGFDVLGCAIEGAAGVPFLRAMRELVWGPASRLVSHETLDRMFAPAKLRSGERVPYGLGWGLELELWHDDTWVFHGGSSPGFSGFLALMPRHRFGLAFLTNLEELQGRGELAEAVTRVVLGFEPSKD
jgi:hypothetical protein